jgi:hypothetical protein
MIRYEIARSVIKFHRRTPTLRVLAVITDILLLVWKFSDWKHVRVVNIVFSLICSFLFSLHMFECPSLFVITIIALSARALCSKVTVGLKWRLSTQHKKLSIAACSSCKLGSSTAYHEWRSLFAFPPPVRIGTSGLFPVGFNLEALILYAVDRNPQTDDQPVARPLPTQDNTNKKRRHLCLECDSNPRSHCSSDLTHCVATVSSF